MGFKVFLSRGILTSKFFKDIRTFFFFLPLVENPCLRWFRQKVGMAYTTEKFESCLTSGTAASWGSDVTMGTCFLSMHKLFLCWRSISRQYFPHSGSIAAHSSRLTFY